MKCRKKKIWMMIGALAVLAVIGGSFVCQIRAEPEKKSPVLITEYVSVPAYTGRIFSPVKPESVDDDYMDSLMSRMLETYNEVRGTDYESWTDDQVAYTTQGRYTSETEWRDYLKEKYRDVEREQAKEDMAQLILSEIVSETELTGYDEGDYAAAREAVAGQLVYGNGFTSKEELLEGLELSEKEYDDMVDEYANESLKYAYVISAIAEAEGLEPTEDEMAQAEEEHMAGVLEMGYTEADAYYQEELEHWKEKEERYRLSLMSKNVRDFLYENNHMQ